jgi:hypothetical protein
MVIQFKTDKNIPGSEEYTVQFITQIQTDLSRYRHHVNEIKVYLSDEEVQNGCHTNACLLWATVEGHKTFEISGRGDTPEQAVGSSLVELKLTLNLLLGS